MVERIQEVEQTVERDETPVTTTKRESIRTASNTVSTDPAATVDRTCASTAERVVYYITGLLLTLLAFRFLLSLLGANRGNGFASLIYGVSYPFVAPFFGLFGYKVQYGVARFEVETLVAMAVYGLLGYGIVKLIRIARHAS